MKYSQRELLTSITNHVKTDIYGPEKGKANNEPPQQAAQPVANSSQNHQSNSSAARSFLDMIDRNEKKISSVKK